MNADNVKFGRWYRVKAFPLLDRPEAAVTVLERRTPDSFNVKYLDGQRLTVAACDLFEFDRNYFAATEERGHD
jgi:hypothetical protein